MATTSTMINVTSAFKISPTIPQTFPNTTGIIITVISLAITSMIVLQFIRFVLMKHFNPLRYKYLHEITPLSSALVKSIHCVDCFTMLSQWYLIIGSGISLSFWGYYCDQYEYEYDSQKTIDESCAFDAYCELSPSACQSPSWTPLFATGGIFLAFFGVPVIVIRLKIWCKPILDTTQNCEFYDQPKGRVFTYVTVWNVFFFLYTISFSVLFHGPNINYVEMYSVASVLIVWLCNNVGIKYFYCTYHPKYNLGKHILFLLNIQFGRHLGKIIYAYLKDVGIVIKEGHEQRKLLGTTSRT